jgi:asparagine synthase (glutamine-hydrolysing)
MSALAGFWNFDGRSAERTVASSLAEALASPGGDRGVIWCDGAAGLACRLQRVAPESAAECQPVVDTFGHALLFDGRLDNRESLLAQLAGDAPDEGAADSTLVLAAWRLWGMTSLARLEGDFALALFDARAQRVVLARDPVGCRPLYYWIDDKTLVFATEIKAILAHPDVPARPNDDLLADAFLLDRLPYDDEGETFFAGIHAVLPGCWLRVAPRHSRSGQFWDFDPRAQLRLASYDDYADRLRELLIQSVRRRLRSAHPVAVAASGGLDSSVVLCIADDLRKSGESAVSIVPLTYTPADDPSSEENQFLGLLESGRGLQVGRVTIDDPGDAAEIERAAWHSESPLFDAAWCAQRPLLASAAARGARTLLTGLWSDQFLFVTGYLADLVRALSWRQVGRHLDEYRRWFVDADPAYFRARFRRELLANLAPDAVRTWLRPFRSVFDRPLKRPSFRGDWPARVKRRRPRADRPAYATAHAGTIYQTARALSHRLQFEADTKLANSRGIDLVTPFLDRDVIAFLMSIPGDVQTHGGVPRALLRDAMRGIVPEPILRRRWRRAPAAASAAAVDSLEISGFEIWSRIFFSGKLAAPPAQIR